MWMNAHTVSLMQADIWSLGITIYEIATGNPPFADQDPMRAVSLIPKSRPAQLEGDWSPAMKEFVALCLHEEPNKVNRQGFSYSEFRRVHDQIMEFIS